jgi:hypothetical protein
MSARRIEGRCLSALLLALLSTGCDNRRETPRRGPALARPSETVAAADAGDRSPHDKSAAACPLRMNLRQPSRPAPPEETVILRLQIRNVSSAPVDLPWPKFIDQFITSEIQSPDGAANRVKHTGLALGHGRYPGGDLHPPEVMIVELPHTFPAPGRYTVKCILEPTREGCPWWSFWEGRVESNRISVEIASDRADATPATTLNPDLRKSFASPTGEFTVCLHGDRRALRAYFALGAFPHTTGELPLKRTLTPIRCVFYRGPNLERYVNPPKGPVSPPTPSTPEYSVREVADLAVTIVARERKREPEAYVHVTLSEFTVGKETFAALGPIRLPLRGPYP